LFEHFNLEPGVQSRVLAVKDLKIEDKVKLVARVVHHNCGPSFVPKCKFALDAVNGTVYVLVENAEVAELDDWLLLPCGRRAYYFLWCA